MAAPLVSVILPVRNGGAFLRPAVQSILGQTLEDAELLLVDDHSSDGSVDELDIADPRLHVLNSRGFGVVNAFATGLGRAHGRYIARMDADDISLPRRLEVQVGLLEGSPEIDIAGGCVRFIGADVAEGNRRYQDWLNSVRSPAEIHAQLFIESPVPNPTALFRAAALRRLDGYRNCDWPEDYDLFLRADAAGMKMAKPEEIVLEWRDHEARLTRNDELYARERFQAAKAHYLARHRLPDRELLLWGAGPTGKLMHDLLAAEGVGVSGFLEVHPRRIGGTKRGKPVHGLDHLSENADAFVLVAVGARGARDEIRAFMSQAGRKESEEFLFAA